MLHCKTDYFKEEIKEGVEEDFKYNHVWKFQVPLRVFCIQLAWSITEVKRLKGTDPINVLNEIAFLPP